MKFSGQKWKEYALVVAVCIIGALSLKMYVDTIQSPQFSTGLRENSSKYHYINPLLATGDSESSPSFDDLRTQLADHISRGIRDNEIVSASVYFRDLNSSSWTGVNENEKFAPASMYKVAVLIAFLKDAYETHPNLLDEKLTITINNKKGVFTVGELLRVMITESNNDAKNVLESVLKPELRQKVFSDFGLLSPSVNDPGDTLSAKEYSLFFRILYNATYLGSDLSEAALQTLSETTFNDGLVAGVASTTQVAHKFGYRVFDTAKNTFPQELSDCGIVYYPGHPYFLCVMTRGSDADSLKSFIKDVSRTAYTYVAKKF